MADTDTQPTPDESDPSDSTADAAASGGAGGSVQSPPPPQISLPSLTRRDLRIGERLVEGTIFAVATLSIVFIFLIFLFVFREAAPIVLGSDRPVHTERAAADTARAVDTSRALDTARAVDTARTATASGRETTLAQKIEATGYPVLTHDSPVELSHLAYDIWQPNSEHPRYGIFPILIGTLKTTLVALLIAIPLSILAALYSAFFAPRWVREYLKPAIELLAGFPSVVLGFFCLMTVATIVQSVFGIETRLNAFVGGIGLALAVIPIIYTISDDALRAVPLSLREAALALGATEWQTAYQVMLPAATPGIFAAVLLGLGRAFGETMIALMATGNAGTFNWNVFDSVRTMAATIGAEMGEVVQGSPHYQILFFLGVILFIFSFAINLVTEFYVKQRLIKRFRGQE